MLDDAVNARMIGANTLKTEVPTRNRGRRSARMQPATRPKLHAAPDQVLAVAVNIEPAAGIGAFMRVLISAWTGIRSGESAALLRTGVLDGPPRVVVDDLEGALKQTRAGISRGTPKGGIGREASLPPSPAALLEAWLAFSEAPEVFPGAVVRRKGGPVREPTWTRDTWKHRWRTACDGRHDLAREGRKFVELDTWAVPPVVPGLEFKGLRRAHNVWLTEAGVPEVARAYRLGHAMSDDMQAAYSLVSGVMEAQVLAALEVFWAEAFRGPAGAAAVEIISRFAPDLARAYEKALPGVPGKGLWPAV
jgi:integrase